MSTTSFLGGESVAIWCILLLGALPAPAGGPAGSAPLPDKAQRHGGEQVRRRVKMIDALANRNRPPRLEYDKGGFGPYPRFPADYDWVEQRRVLLALSDLSKGRTPEIWEELVHRIGDRRYCLTLKDEGGFYAMGNFTVGNVCHHRALDWLCGVCERHLPRDFSGYPIKLRLCPGGLRQWRKQREGKQLYELQIEVCEDAIRELATVKDATASQREKDRARKKIEEEITKLRRTKRPIFTNYSRLIVECYTPEGAQEALEDLKRKPCE